jgi:hypothetical protein
MSDEIGAAGSAQRLTELAQRLNQLNAARFTAMPDGKSTQLPPHLTENISGKKTSAGNPAAISK